LFVKFGSIKQDSIHKQRSPRSMRHLLDRAQRASEDAARGARKLSKDFDIAMARQRDLVYDVRNEIITGDPITQEEVQRIAAEVFVDAMAAHAGDTPAALMRYIFDNLSYHLPLDFDSLDTANADHVREYLATIFSRAVQEKVDTLQESDVYAK